MEATASHLAAKTPDSRDRYFDFLRAFSIVVVVLGHWLIAVIRWEDGHIAVHNAVGHQRGLWLATWFLQVMPIFFFVGGFAHAVGWDSVRRSGGGLRMFLGRRLERLLRPTLVFAAVWVVIEVVLHLTDTGAPGILRGTFLPFGPLWFLGVYMVVVAATPAMSRLHARYRIGVPLALAAGVVAVDAIRFGTGFDGIGWANLLLVWLAVHQAGFFHADGSLVAAGRRVWWTLVGTGLSALIVLTNLTEMVGHLWYPRSMVGVDIEPVSNMSPPSLAILALATWQIGAAMLMRRRVGRWLSGRKPWTRVIAVNGVIMTLFLWHLTALVVVILVLHPLGFGTETTTSARWRLERPLWILAPALVLAPMMIVFARFERPRLPSR